MKNIDPITCLRHSADFSDAVEFFKKNCSPFIIIIDDNSRPVGFLEEFKIRQLFLTGTPSNTSVSALMNRDFLMQRATTGVVMPNSNHFGKVIAMVDGEQKFMGSIRLEENKLKKTLMPPMLIVAGGYGLRMLELTKNTPKPMLELKGKPILAHIINSAKSLGVKKFYIATHYLSEKIQSYFKDGKKLGVSIEYLYEEKPLGTGGCLREVAESEGSLIVSNADIYSLINFRSMLSFHKENSAAVTIAVKRHNIVNPYGVVCFDGDRIIGHDEKPSWATTINAGVYIVQTEYKNLIKRNEAISLPDFIDRVIKKDGKVVGFPLIEDWTDIGTKSNYEKVLSSTV